MKNKENIQKLIKKILDSSRVLCEHPTDTDVCVRGSDINNSAHDLLKLIEIEN